MCVEGEKINVKFNNNYIANNYTSTSYINGWIYGISFNYMHTDICCNDNIALVIEISEKISKAIKKYRRRCGKSEKMD